jgi:hypothetical protein
VISCVACTGEGEIAHKLQEEDIWRRVVISPWLKWPHLCSSVEIFIVIS